jgi:uncharacterized protein (DUF1501 family)
MTDPSQLARDTEAFRLNRRALLGGLAGLSVVFSGRAALAAGAGRPKLVVIIARGGLDGLSVSPPYSDREYAGLRGAIAIPPPGAAGGALKLDDTFGLHPALPQIWAMTQGGEARIAPAVAIPQRIRSHFEAQDMLENGSAAVYGSSTGWLNRAIGVMGTGRALSVGAEAPLVIRGRVQTAAWSPGPNLPQGDRVAGILQDLYKDDPVLAPALASGLTSQAMVQTAMGGEKVKQNDVKALGAAISKFMTAPDGPDVVALALDGFDTHAGQGASTGQLATRLTYVDQLFAGLKTGLGPEWKNTTVVMATEFGRTARINGTLGTDHGTASTVLLAGGALKPGGIVGDWPTLAQNSLFENRDLAPTIEVRSIFKGLLRDHMGVDRARLDTVVFPDSNSVAPCDGLA